MEDIDISNPTSKNVKSKVKGGFKNLDIDIGNLVA